MDKVQHVYQRPVQGQRCSVPGCDQAAKYMVTLVDPAFDFCEQDFTCPFICQQHRDSNERTLEERRTAFGRYRYTNRHGADGYSAFLPVRTGKEESAALPLRRRSAVARPPKSDVCARCGVVGVPLFLHHWAPVARFDDGDNWPKSYLCEPCHRAWHAEMGWRPKKAGQ